MKRFTKMLALGMTLAMVFGMSVSAAPSPYAPGMVTIVEELPEGWVQGTTTEEAYNNAKAAAESADAKAQIELACPGWTFDAVMDVWNFGATSADAKDGFVKVKMPALPDRDNYTYVLLHYPTRDWTNIKGYPAVIDFKLADWENNYWTFQVAGGSPVIFVRLVKKAATTTTTENGNGGAAAPVADAPAAGTPAGGVVSPKTGEAMPVATVMVLVCLAGVAVCAKKVRNNG